MKILLVEPKYKNKFPPIGLMKISTYHKAKRDIVKFVKGTEIVKDVDRIYITSLFSFEYKNTLDTVVFYAENYPDIPIFFGGISASIMYDEFNKELPKNVKIIKGQLTSSTQIGFNDRTNIDRLILDYDILDDIDYVYPESDSYFIHFSRGCVRNCSFCAVADLEPDFRYLSDVGQSIKALEQKYGVKKHLRVMDNNIMYLEEISDMVNTLNSLGYGVESKKVKKEKEIDLLFNKLKRRVFQNQDLKPIMRKISFYLINLFNKKKNNIYKGKTKDYLNHFEELIELLEKYSLDYNFYKSYEQSIKRTVYRFTGSAFILKTVDFNQGIDARGIIKYPDRVGLLSKIRIDPFRVAFDDIKDKDVFVKAIEIAANKGIDTFSNYLLFNYLDTPESMYDRIQININLNNKLRLKNQFSFPMKYAPVKGKDRKYIGKNWSKLELDGFYAILNVSHGIITKERDFFERAYGKNVDEFKEILMMPTLFIKNRRFFEENGYISKWRECFVELAKNEKDELRDAYENNTWDAKPNKVNEIKKFYFKSMHNLI